MYALREIEHETEQEVRQAPPKPRWGWLYSIVVVMGGLLTVTETTIPDGFPRRLLEAIVTVAIFGAMAVWFRFNRVGLALWSEDAAAGPTPRSISAPRARRVERFARRWS